MIQTKIEPFASIKTIMEAIRTVDVSVVDHE